MMIKYSIAIIFILFSILASDLYAQDVNLNATVSANVLTVDDRFEYSVEVSGKSTSLPAVEYPDFSDFYILSGPNTSTSIQLINGAMTSSKTFSFVLQPRAEGKFTIGKATINANGNTYSSKEIVVTVQKGSANQQTQRQAPKNRNDPEVSGKDLFLKTEVSRSKAYIGQQITVEYKLYFRVNIRNYERPNPPKNAGFWTEELKMPNRPRQETEIINGVNYNVASLYKVALFPTQVGELTVEPMQIKLEVLVKNQRRRSIFDSFFDDPFGRTVQKTVASKPIKIDVKSLPVQGKPANFEGNVGKFQFNVSVDKRETRVNEAIALKLKLLGAGNVKLIELPKPVIAADIEQYEPKFATNIENTGNSISGSKSAEYILIPRIEGEYEIKPISFSFFDPGTNKYNTITSQPIRLKIDKGTSTSMVVSSQAGNFTRQEVALLGKDIRFIKEYTEFHPIGKKAYVSLSFISSFFLAIVVFAGFLFYNNYQVKLSGNEHLARSRRAGKHASKQLAEAKRKMSSTNISEFYKAISLALQGFVRDKLNIDLTDFSVVNVRSALGKRKINPDEIDEYIAILEESDFRQFANASALADEKTNLYNKAKEILTKFEKWM